MKTFLVLLALVPSAVRAQGTTCPSPTEKGRRILSALFTRAENKSIRERYGLPAYTGSEYDIGYEVMGPSSDPNACGALVPQFTGPIPQAGRGYTFARSGGFYVVAVTPERIAPDEIGGGLIGIHVFDAQFRRIGSFSY